MSINTKLVGDFFCDISEFNSVEQSFPVFERYVQKLGFDGVSYTVVPELVLNNTFKNGPIFLFSELFPKSFIEQYSAERFDKHDFTITRIKEKKYSPMDWKQYRNSDLLNEAEKRILYIAEQDHGVINALSIPTMAGINGVSGVSIVSSANDADFSLLKNERLGTLQKIVELFHRNNLSFNSYFMKSFFSELSDKEVEVLRYAASGKLIKNISFETDLSATHAANIRSGLRRKLGGVTMDKIMFEIDSRYFD